MRTPGGGSVGRMTFLTRTARIVSGTGVIAVGAAHAIWAIGSTWPARSRRELAEAVVGNPDALPGRGATAVVAATALTAGVVIAGAGGDRDGAVRLRRLAGAALVTRAAVGGEVALAALGLPPAKSKFVALDTRYYRPLCAVLGLGALLGARSRRSRTTDA